MIHLTQHCSSAIIAELRNSGASALINYSTTALTSSSDRISQSTVAIILPAEDCILNVSGPTYCRMSLVFRLIIMDPGLIYSYKNISEEPRKCHNHASTSHQKKKKKKKKKKMVGERGGGGGQTKTKRTPHMKPPTLEQRIATVRSVEKNKLRGYLTHLCLNIFNKLSHHEL